MVGLVLVGPIHGRRSVEAGRLLLLLLVAVAAPEHGARGSLVKRLARAPGPAPTAGLAAHVRPADVIRTTQGHIHAHVIHVHIAHVVHPHAVVHVHVVGVHILSVHLSPLRVGAGRRRAQDCPRGGHGRVEQAPDGGRAPLTPTRGAVGDAFALMGRRTLAQLRHQRHVLLVDFLPVDGLCRRLPRLSLPAVLRNVAGASAA